MAKRRTYRRDQGVLSTPCCATDSQAGVILEVRIGLLTFDKGLIATKRVASLPLDRWHHVHEMDCAVLHTATKVCGPATQ